MKKLFLIVLVAGSALYGFLEKNPDILEPYVQPSTTDNQQIADAYQNRKSDVQAIGSGIVTHILPDGTNGSQHQRFILKLPSDQTILIAHNIDVAPRINTLRAGDTVEFYGEYEWNTKGGIVHWTHHDPGKRHVNGWLKHKGVTYQ